MRAACRDRGITEEGPVNGRSFLSCQRWGVGQMDPVYNEFMYGFRGPEMQLIGVQTTLHVAEAGPGRCRFLSGGHGTGHAL